MTDTSPERRKLAARLVQDGALKTPAWRAAVEAVPRELFLNPGVFLPEGAQWRPVTAVGSDPAEWVRTACTLDTLTTQLDGHLTADQVSEPVAGLPTSSSTTPALVLSMIESLEVESGHQVLEIGTGTGYSAALMCHRLGEDNVTTVEVDPEVAARADAALETAGYSTWTVTGDGLLGHPRRAPYDRVIATCAVRRIPYAWVRQTKPGGIILATVGSWANGAGLAKVTVNEDGEAGGRIIGRASFMQARSQAAVPVAGDLSARTAYADSERQTKVSPLMLDEWMPAFLAQLATPGAQLVRATTREGARLIHLFAPERESFAEFTADGAGWRVRQGGPVALWDDIEEALTAWQEAGSPDITAVRLRVTPASHQYQAPALPETWWNHLRQPLGALADVPTDRTAVREEYVRRAVPQYTGHTVGTIPWATAHGDLQWANLTAPGMLLMDWEAWAQRPSATTPPASCSTPSPSPAPPPASAQSSPTSSTHPKAPPVSSSRAPSSSRPRRASPSMPTWKRPFAPISPRSTTRDPGLPALRNQPVGPYAGFSP